MGGTFTRAVIGTDGGAFRITGFVDAVYSSGGDRAERLRAVVLWRSHSTTSVPLASGASASRPQRRADLLEQSLALNSDLVRQLEQGWDGASDPGGDHEILYSRQRHLLRVLGVDHEVPNDGRTLVAMVEDFRGSTGDSSVVLHPVQLAEQKRLQLDPTRPRAENEKRVIADSNASIDGWVRQLEHDAVIWAFMAHH